MLSSAILAAGLLVPSLPAIPEVARPLPLSAVRVTGGPLKRAQDLDAAYLLKLEPDRMLALFRQEAGLKPRALPYGGWDGPGKNLTGHILGHYLSAVSFMGEATGDPRFKARADYILKELKEVQETQGDGYLGALEHGKEAFWALAKGDIRTTGFDLNGLWSPWYVLHKVFAGLRDAHRHGGSPLALQLETNFAAWTEGILSGLSPSQIQSMLATEFGGMGEVLVDLYADTGNPRWLVLSRKFEHSAVLDPLKRHQDRLAGLHGNTQVPKLLGNLARYACVGDTGDGFAAGFFWDTVVQRHTWATGGHGRNEYFFDPGRMSENVEGRTAETCNVYNMLKMARRLFALRRDAPYAEFQERALFNHILASMDPMDGRTCYMVPVGSGVQHEYQDMDKDFTCCVGSGMESHALHGAGIYHESGDRLWVNLFVPSTARWEAAGLDLAQETDLPLGDSMRLSLTLREPRAFTLALRRPAWALEGFTVKVNGESVSILPAPGSYVELARTWKTGDRVELSLPKTLRLEPLADDPSRAAILWGPLVLAADLGPEEGFEAWREGAVPAMVVPEGMAPWAWLRPVLGQPGHFRTGGAGRPRDVEFSPFFALHRRSYSVYTGIFTPGAWAKRSESLCLERERQGRLQAATVAFVQPGEMQPERDFGFRGEGLVLDESRIQGRAFRRSSKWFSFTMPVDSSRPMSLAVTFLQDEWRKRTLDIRVEGRKIGEQTLDRGGTPRFFDAVYAIPEELTRGRTSVTVRFEATQQNETPAVFGVRTFRTH